VLSGGQRLRRRPPSASPVRNGMVFFFQLALSRVSFAFIDSRQLSTGAIQRIQGSDKATRCNLILIII
jgi:hypothetical protein